MSRETVRAGIAAWLSEGNLPNLGTVFAGTPRIIPGKAFFPAEVGADFGVIICVHIRADSEQRVAIGGETGGWKQIDYSVDLQICCRQNLSDIPSDPEHEDDLGLIATANFDHFYDTLKDRIRSDRTAADAVWQWGEARLAGRYGELVDRGSSLEQWATITTTATEFIPS